jgi:hypothetical protein
MVKLTIATLKDVELFDLDNGSIIMHVGEYTHCYDDMSSLATDLLEYANEQSTDGWEGNEPEFNTASYRYAEGINQIIDSEGVLSGRGGAYISLIRALVAQMDDDYIYMA